MKYHNLQICVIQLKRLERIFEEKLDDLVKLTIKVDKSDDLIKYNYQDAKWEASLMGQTERNTSVFGQQMMFKLKTSDSD